MWKNKYSPFRALNWKNKLVSSMKTEFRIRTRYSWWPVTSMCLRLWQSTIPRAVTHMMVVPGVRSHVRIQRVVVIPSTWHLRTCNWTLERRHWFQHPFQGVRIHIHSIPWKNVDYLWNIWLPLSYKRNNSFKFFSSSHTVWSAVSRPQIVPHVLIRSRTQVSRSMTHGIGR